MFDNSDVRKDIAMRILVDELSITPTEIIRFTNGYCHSVYHVKTVNNELVLRLTGENNERYYLGSVKWLPELNVLGIPVPKILKHGRYKEIFYTLLSFIPGKDIGEAYHTLTDLQKRNITKKLSAIQRKVSLLPKGDSYGYTADNEVFKTWTDFLNSQINRSKERIKQNGILNAGICDTVKAKMSLLEEYFVNVPLTAFLGDITTKNVLVHEGQLYGIIDVDEMCYGDSLFVIGLTNMALLAMGADTNYIDYWLDEIKAGEIQRKAVMFYTLLFCVDFMGEQGMKFDNGNTAAINQNSIKRLNSIFADLCRVV